MGRCPFCGAFDGSDHHSLCQAIKRPAEDKMSKTDRQRLDFLDSSGYPGMKWVARDSLTDRGLRLHQDPVGGKYATVREAIDAYMRGDRA